MNSKTKFLLAVLACAAAGLLALAQDLSSQNSKIPASALEPVIRGGSTTADPAPQVTIQWETSDFFGPKGIEWKDHEYGLGSDGLVHWRMKSTAKAKK